MTEPFGLYIHVPFCATRCGYCDFNTYTPGELGSPRNLTGPYLDALDRELELAAARVGRPAETVFIGGGTPSLLGGQGLSRILNSPVFFNFEHIELFPHIHGVSLVLSLNKYL